MRADAASVYVCVCMQDSVNKTISLGQIKVYCPVLVFQLDSSELD